VLGHELRAAFGDQGLQGLDKAGKFLREQRDLFGERGRERYAGKPHDADEGEEDRQRRHQPAEAQPLHAPRHRVQ
jgi:hypothetical protein